MKAIVFAAGNGTRLKPFTDEHPKALAPVCGHPALGLVIGKLIAAGADGIVVNVHHFARQVVDFVESQNYGVPVEISDESSLLLDTGGAIAKIYRESRLMATLGAEEPVVVHNADILTDFPINSLTDALAGNAAAILVNPSRESSRKFLFDTDGILRGWENKRTAVIRPVGLTTEGLHEAAFGGVHAIYKATMRNISDYCGDLCPFSITDYYIDVCGSCRIKGFTPDGDFRWFDIGTPEKLEAAQSFLS